MKLFSIIGSIALSLALGGSDVEVKNNVTGPNTNNNPTISGVPDNFTSPNLGAKSIRSKDQSFGYGSENKLDPDTRQDAPLIYRYEVYKADSKILNVTIVEYPTNKLCRSYKVDGKISNNEATHFERPLDKKSDFSSIGPLGQKLINILFEIEGITQIFLEPEGLSVHMGRAFDWKSVEPLVLQVVRDIILRGEAHIYQALKSSVTIVIENFPNQQIRAFHTDRVLSDRSVAYFGGYRGKESWNESLRGLGELGRSLVIQIRQLEGVEGATLMPYRVEVDMAEGYQWTPKAEAMVSKIIRETINGKRVPDSPRPKRSNPRPRRDIA